MEIQNDLFEIGAALFVISEVELDERPGLALLVRLLAERIDGLADSIRMEG